MINPSRIKLGEIIAPRFWIVCNRYKKICGPARLACWPYDRPMAGENTERNKNDGVYAFKDKFRIYDYVEQNRNEIRDFLAREPCAWMQPTGLVIGTIRMWGYVVPAETGYRAQFGRVQTLDEIIDLPDLVMRRTEGDDLSFLRQQYGLWSAAVIHSQPLANSGWA